MAQRPDNESGNESDNPEAHDPWLAARRRLEAERRALAAQINAYPPPITACDAQFNHLLDRRRALSAALRDLDASRPSGTVPAGALR